MLSEWKQGGKKLTEIRVFHGLNEMSVEAGFPRAAAVVVLPPARQGHDDHSFSPRMASNPPAGLCSADLREADIEKDYVGTKLFGGFNSGQTVVNNECLVAAHL